MANYCDYATRIQDDPEQVGVGFGDRDGRGYVCVSGLAEPNANGLDWVALTPQCAKQLYELLDLVKHTFMHVHVPSLIPGGAEVDGWTGGDGHVHVSKDGTGPCVPWCDACAEKNRKGP